MPGKVLLATAVLMAGAGFPATDMYLGRVAGSADAIDSRLTLEPAHPTVSVRVSNTSGKPGRVVGWLGDKAATAATPDHSAIVTLTWDSPATADGDSGVLRLELYPEGETLRPMDIEEHPYSVGARTYNQPSQWPSGSSSWSSSPNPSWSSTPKPSGSSWSSSPKPSGSSRSPKPSRSTSTSPKPSNSTSESPKPSNSGSSSPGSSSPGSSSGEVLPLTGSGTSLVAVLGGGSIFFGMFVLGLAWVLRKRSLRDRLS